MRGRRLAIPLGPAVFVSVLCLNVRYYCWQKGLLLQGGGCKMLVYIRGLGMKEMRGIGGEMIMIWSPKTEPLMLLWKKCEEYVRGSR